MSSRASWLDHRFQVVGDGPLTPGINDWGTPANPKIIVLEGPEMIDINSDVNRYGVLVIKDMSIDFKLNVDFTFKGLIIFQSNNFEIELTGLGMANLFGAILRDAGTLAEEKRVTKRARELLDFVGLGGHENELAKNLAYGDQGRLEIARGLATDPKLLLLDEPPAGMNPQETLAMVSFIRRLRDELKLTILLIEHHMKVARW